MSEALPWHEPLITRLQALLVNGTLPNAMALTCPPGWGHEQLLAHVALMLLGVTGDKTGEEFAHPDFRWVVPEGAVIKIDQIRRLNEFAVQTTQPGGRKIAAILDAHLLNPNAANALLKTLEEPPPDTHILLATPFWGKLLPTIRSRCQRFQITPNVSAAQQWLAEQGIALDDDTFAEHGYAPLAAAAAVLDSQLDLNAWLAALSAGALEAAVAQASEGDVVMWLSRWYRRILMHLKGNPIPRCAATAPQLLGFADEVLAVRRQVETSNATNSRLLLEGLVVRWLQMQRSAAA